MLVVRLVVFASASAGTFSICAARIVVNSADIKETDTETNSLQLLLHLCGLVLGAGDGGDGCARVEDWQDVLADRVVHLVERDMLGVAKDSVT